MLKPDAVDKVDDVRTALAKEGFKVEKDLYKKLSSEEAAVLLGGDAEEKAADIEHLTR